MNKFKNDKTFNTIQDLTSFIQANKNLFTMKKISEAAESKGFDVKKFNRKIFRPDRFSAENIFGRNKFRPKIFATETIFGGHKFSAKNK